MAASATTASDRVRALNDQLRQHRIGGKVVITSRVQALSLSLLMLIEDAVARFDAFDSDNDPHGEHDFGVVRVQGHTVFFKIDAYDTDLRFHSPDPADPGVTRRVMTLMLAEEY
jgi:hypothetical protein